MSQTNDYQNACFQFVGVLAREYKSFSVEELVTGVQRLLPLVDQYQKLSVKACNVQLSDSEQMLLDETLETKICLVNKRYFGNILELDFTGDPRGYVIKLKLPSGYSNSFAGELYCVPTYNY